MLHCVSVGELLSVRLLIDQLLAADPDLRILLTATTDTGIARARELYGVPENPKPPYERVETYRYPLDFSWAVRRFLNHARPDVVALVELETWPNFLRIAHRRGIPVAVINGRMTARALRRYRWIGPVVRSMFQQVAWFGLQTPEIAERFAALGAPTNRITIYPTIKYDAVAIGNGEMPGARALAEACGLSAINGGSLRLLVGGSTGPGEENPLLETYRALHSKYPELRLAIATRKPETLPQVIAAIERAGLKIVRRTQRPDGAVSPSPLAADEVLLLDTMGELKKLYALAHVVFVGRSLVNLGGSDMIEVAALGKPCCFGPHTHNFAEAVDLLTRAGAATVVRDAAELTATIDSWLAAPEAAAAMGRTARQVVAGQQGSTGKYAHKLLTLLRETDHQNG